MIASAYWPARSSSDFAIWSGLLSALSTTRLTPSSLAPFFMKSMQLFQNFAASVGTTTPPLPFSRGPSRAPLSPHRLARPRQRYGEIDRLDKARLARDSAARYVEGRPMVDGRPDDGKAERDVDAAQRLPAAGRLVDGEAEQLDRDVALVVVHGDHGVELLRAQLHKHGVAGHGPVNIKALLAQPLDGRFDDIDVLPSEQAAFARMRIERCDGDAAARHAKRLERFVGKRDDTAYPFRRHALRHVFKRGMGGDVAHAHGSVNQ